MDHLTSFFNHSIKYFMRRLPIKLINIGRKMNIIVDTDCGFDDMFALSLIDLCPNLNITLISTVDGINNKIDGYNTMKTLFSSSMYSSKPLVICGQENFNDSKLNSIDWISSYKTLLSQFTNNMIKPEVTVFQSTINNMELTQAIPTVIRKDELNILLCLGPLTNISAVLRTNPTLFTENNISRIVLMGGTLETSSGLPDNAEFNFYLDPQAIYDVLHYSGITIEIIPLDICNLTSAEYNQTNNNNKNNNNTIDTTTNIQNNPSPKEIIRYLYDFYPDSASYDSIAAFYLSKPEAFKMKMRDVMVDSITGRLYTTDAGSSGMNGYIPDELVAGVQSCSTSTGSSNSSSDKICTEQNTTKVLIAAEFDHLLYREYLNTILLS